MKALSLAIIAVIECAKAAGVDIESVIRILRSEITSDKELER